MRLLTVSSYFDTHPGGLERVAGTLARELGRRGWTSRWLAGDATTAPPDIAHVTHVAVPVVNIAERRLKVPFPLLMPRGLWQLIDEVRRADAVIVHDGLYMTSVSAVVTARLLKRPVIVVQHISLVPYSNPMLRLAMRAGVECVARPVMTLASEVVFISRGVQTFFERGPRQRPTHLILNGVDTDTFRPCVTAFERAALRARLNLPRNAKVALFVGRFVEKKGLDHIRAAALAGPDVTWLLAGWGDIAPENWGLPNVRVRRGLSGAPLADLYRAADVFTLPSFGEGFPLVVQEAMATGLPIVCGRDSAAADPEAAPLLLPIDVDEAPATAVRLCEALDIALAEAGALQEVRVLYARRRYAWSSAAARYAELLRGLVPASEAPVVSRQPSQSSSRRAA